MCLWIWSLMSEVCVTMSFHHILNLTWSFSKDLLFQVVLQWLSVARPWQCLTKVIVWVEEYGYWFLSTHRVWYSKRWGAPALPFWPSFFCKWAGTCCKNPKCECSCNEKRLAEPWLCSLCFGEVSKTHRNINNFSSHMRRNHKIWSSPGILLTWGLPVMASFSKLQ